MKMDGLPPYRYERPMAVEYGRLSVVGERLVCHLCGRDWLNLGTHAWLTHGLTADEYRVEFGLNRVQALTAPSVSRRLAELSRARFLAGQSGLLPLDADGMRRMAQGAHKLARAQRKIEQSIKRGGADPCPRGHTRSRKPSGGLICRFCTDSRPRTPRLVFLGPLKPRSLIGDVCSKGHPWDGYLVKNWNGHQQRKCRQCNRDSVKAWRKEHPDRFKAQRVRQRARRAASAG